LRSIRRAWSADDAAAQTVQRQTMPKAKVYAVARGHSVGLFDTWVDGAQAATQGFPSAKFKSFKQRAEAEAYLRANGVSVPAAEGSSRPAAPLRAAAAAAPAPASAGGVVDLTADEPTGQSVSRYFSPPKASVGAATWFAAQAAAAAPVRAQAPGAGGAAAATGADDLDGLDDSIFADIDVDAIVRRHSQEGVGADRQKRPRPVSPAASGGQQQQTGGCAIHARSEPYCSACQNSDGSSSGNSSKRRRHTAPAAPQPLSTGPRRPLRADPGKIQPFHADDAVPQAQLLPPLSDKDTIVCQDKLGAKSYQEVML
jgi:hypothetical protein